MKKGIVSIIIPVFNRRDELRKCLESIYQQDYENIEVIVVDDCSSEDILGLLKADYPNVRPIKNDIHMGPSFLRNQGIVVSGGEYILFLDSDTEFATKMAISDMVRTLEANGDYGSIGGELVTKENCMLGAYGKKIGFDGQAGSVLARKEGPSLRSCDYLASCNCMVRREVLYKIGGFDPYWEFGGEDMDVGFRISRMGYKNIVWFDAAVLHRRSPKGRSIWETYLYHRSRIRFVIKNFGIVRFLAVSIIDILKVLGFYLILPLKLAIKILLRQGIKKENLLGGLLIFTAYIWNLFKLCQTIKSRKTNFLHDEEIIQYKRIRAASGGLAKNIILYGMTAKIILWFRNFAFLVLRALPRMLQLMACQGYVAYKKRRLKKLTTPTAIIFFVTNKCNFKCKHCFFWQDVNAALGELDIAEIKKIAISLRHPICLSLTGGEPFLRDDLGEICVLFNRLNNAQEIGIATNGFFPERVVNICEYVLRNSNLKSMEVQISLDGLEKTHDNIRGVKGAFSKALQTVRGLEGLQGRFPNLKISLAYTIQKANIHEVEDFIRHILPFRVPIRFNIVRGSSFGTYCLPPEASSEIDPREADSAIIPLTLLEETFEKIRKLNKESDFKFWPKFYQKLIEISLNILRQEKKQLPCYAGIIDAVMYANGDVAMCELTKPFGNVKDFNYDFYKLWQSQDAADMRKLINRCFCIHGCNLTTSLTFKPEAVLARIVERNRKKNQ